MTAKAAIAITGGCCLGAYFAFSAIRKHLMYQRARFWPSVLGTITESLLYQDPSQGNATHFRVSYEFVVGDTLRGSTPRLCGDWFWSKQQQAVFVGRYVIGQQVEVFYDPRDPKKNCLDREDKTGISALWMLAASLTFLAFALLWLVS
jgi:hypothetical protein